MRVVWIIGAPATAAKHLQNALAPDRVNGVQYFVRAAQSLEEIPQEHCEDPGVTALVDSADPTLGGFEGLKQLRTRFSFKGPIFLIGEPAPDQVTQPFTEFQLAGCVPSEERCDFNFVAGLIHTHLNFDGTLDLTSFLNPGGRSASEKITSLKDFSRFSEKLANFVGRFGIDLAQLRKALMGISLSHVKTGAGSATIDRPFELHYGMDARKVLVAISTYSRGATCEGVRDEFCKALVSLKTAQPSNSTMFPEFHHAVKATSNMVLISGSAKSDQAPMDPMILLSMLPFPKKQNQIANSFAFVHVRPSEELPEESAQIASPVTKPVVALSTTMPDPADVPAAGLIQQPDMDKLLSDPIIQGDQPVEVRDAQDPLDASDSAHVDAANLEAAALSAEEQKKLDKEKEELERICRALGEDIRRLMKERREPTTDRELRDANNSMNEKFKKVQADLTKSTEWLKVKEKELAALKAQYDILRKETEQLRKSNKAA